MLTFPDGSTHSRSTTPGEAAATSDAVDAFVCLLPRLCVVLAQTPVQQFPLARQHLALMLLTLTAISQEPGHAADLFSRKLIFRPSLPQLVRARSGQEHTHPTDMRASLYLRAHLLRPRSQQPRKFPLDNEPRPIAAALYDSIALVLWSARSKPLAIDAIVYGARRPRRRTASASGSHARQTARCAPHGTTIARAALGLLQRLLHQQIRLRVRLGYDWATLYECVFALMETLAGVVKSGTVTVEDPVWTAVDRVRTPRTPLFCEDPRREANPPSLPPRQVSRIANVWLYYGDALLPTNASFARLLYELMRHAPGCETLRAAGTQKDTRMDGTRVVMLT